MPEMSLFEEAMLNVNEFPAVITQKGQDKLYDLFEHLCNGGTIYDFEDMEPEGCALFMALCIHMNRTRILAAHED